MLLIVLVMAVGCGGGGKVSGGSSKLIAITLSPSSSTIPDGLWQQFTVTGNYSDGHTQNVTGAATWTSSDSGVATIGSSTGVATAVAPGTTTIVASYGGFSESATLIVTPAVLASIAVEPSLSSIAVGTIEQFTATGLLTDNTTTILTTSVSWSSSPSTVASVSNAIGSQGLVTSDASGTALITARLGTISGTATLVVTGGSAATTENILPITVNGSLCAPATSSSYLNKPCVSVTVCVHDSKTACNTINDIILDTGSFGLRIFKTAPDFSVSNSLTQVLAANGGSLAECVQFGDGSSEWGPVKLADVILGNELAANIPIQVIDSTFGTVPSACGTPDASPFDTPGVGFYGILGVGVFKEDCGSGCQKQTDNGIYYSCNGSVCSGTTVALSDQVQNPVASLLTDNNGVIVELPSISSNGTTSANGNLVLGIGTQSNNNKPNDVTTFQTDFVGEIRTVFNGSTYNSIIDSGSNGLFFTSPSDSMIPACPPPNSGGWFCPASTTTLFAVNTDASGSTSGQVLFQIGNYTTLNGSGNNVFTDIGASLPNMFDWGLPFYFGRNVFIGIGSNFGYFAY